MDTFTTFGDLLKHLRRRARLTQRELGVAVRYSESQIARLEANQRLPDVVAIKALFVNALLLDYEPQMASRLIALAEEARDDAGPVHATTLQNPSVVRLARFIGREHELVEVKQSLIRSRLVTLTGTGGVGKTRLAVEVAASFADAAPSHPSPFPDGVWLAELAPISDPASVSRAVASIFGLPVRAGRPSVQALMTHLREKHLLLLLDNCEHLIAVCASLAEALLSACEHVTILATSREPLRAAGEIVWRVPPLSTPDLEDLPEPAHILTYDAVRLFVENASAAQPGFTPSPADIRTIARICHMLDGIPLAIEMAAAQVPALSIAEIAAGLDDRFALLSSGRRTAAPRQQTLRATLDWSYALLSKQEQVLLARLSVFAGSWTAKAARSVCADGRGQMSQSGRRKRRAETYTRLRTASLAISPSDVLPLLAQLVHKSVVVAEERDGEKGYRLLEIIRQYALEQLEASGQLDMIRRRHASYLVRLIEKADLPWPHMEDMPWYRQLESEYSDLRAALDWCYSPNGDPILGLRLAVTLAGFWQYRGWFWRAPGWLNEGRDLLENALAKTPSAPVALRAAALFWLALMQSTYDGAKSLAEECLALSRQTGDKGYVAAALTNLGLLVLWERDYDRAEMLIQESLALCRELGAKEHVASALTHLGRAYLEHGRYAQAIEVLEESLALWREKGIKWSSLGGMARSLLWLGRASHLQGDPARGTSWLEESLDLYRDAGDKNGAGWVLVYLGDAALACADAASAAQRFRDSLKLFAESEDVSGFGAALAGLSSALDRQGLSKLATRLAGAASVIGDVEAPRWHPLMNETVIYERACAMANARLSDPSFAAAWTEGRQMTLKQAIEASLAV